MGGQMSNDALHPLEQLSLGGDGTVRGYPTNGVAGDTAASFSLEYRAAPISLPIGKMQGQLRPHLFTDFGFAETKVPAQTEHLASVGIGGDITLGENFVAKFDLAQTLSAAGKTAAGETSVALQLTARF
jgi:hemolysin activation/secretion protein